VEVIKLDHVRNRPPRFAHLWKTADVGSVFRFSGALDGFGDPLASAMHWCRKYRPDLGVWHSVGVDGVLHVRFTKADEAPPIARTSGKAGLRPPPKPARNASNGAYHYRRAAAREREHDGEPLVRRYDGDGLTGR
jgi:hypothetical protein